MPYTKIRPSAALPTIGDRKMSQFRLPEETRAALNTMARERGTDMTEVIVWLVAERRALGTARRVPGAPSIRELQEREEREKTIAAEKIAHPTIKVLAAADKVASAADRKLTVKERIKAMEAAAAALDRQPILKPNGKLR